MNQFDRNIILYSIAIGLLFMLACLGLFELLMGGAL
jgi:hypothetical protein